MLPAYRLAGFHPTTELMIVEIDLTPEQAQKLMLIAGIDPENPDHLQGDWPLELFLCPV